MLITFWFASGRVITGRCVGSAAISRNGAFAVPVPCRSRRLATDHVPAPSASAWPGCSAAIAADRRAPLVSGETLLSYGSWIVTAGGAKPQSGNGDAGSQL